MSRIPPEKFEHVSSDLLKTLMHHDAEIASLGSRMSGVENEVRNLAATVTKGFSEMIDRLSTFESERGPGIGSILGFVATGGAVIAMSAAAITVLVTSFVSPPITKLEGQVARLSYYVNQREEMERQDYIELRRSRDKDTADDIRQLGKALRNLETLAAAQLRKTTPP